MLVRAFLKFRMCSLREPGSKVGESLVLLDVYFLGLWNLSGKKRAFEVYGPIELIDKVNLLSRT